MRLSDWRISRAHLLAALMVGTGVVLYLSLFVWPATPLLLPSDQFINFDDARRMASGEVLYRDIFQYTLPGTELLELALIKLFGTKIAILNVMMIAVGVIDVALAMVLASSVLGDWDAVLATLLFLCFGFHCSLGATHHPFSVMFVYAATAAIIRKRTPRRLMIAGALLGLATCFTQTRALAAIAIAGFVWWENRKPPEADHHLWRDEACLLAPFALVVCAGCAYVVWNAGLNHFYRYIIRFPLLYYREGSTNSWATSFWVFTPTLRGIAQWAMLKLLVPGAFVAFAIYYRRARIRGESVPASLLLISVVGVALFATIAYAPLHGRLGEISLPAFIVAIWMIERIEVAWWKVPAWAVATAFVILAPIAAQRMPYHYFDGEAGRAATADPGLLDEFTWLREHTKPGDYFFAANSPGLYVLLGLRNPSRVPFVEPNDYTRPSQVRRMVRRLAERRTEYVLWQLDPRDADDPGDRLFPVGEFLRACYRPVTQLRDGELLQRKQGDCPYANAILLKDRGKGERQQGGPPGSL